MDWQSGRVNAKYWVTHLLATTVGDASEKTLYNCTVDAPSVAPPVPSGATGNGTCGVTTWGDDCDATPLGAWNTTARGITSLADCVAAVAKCSMGNYASFSLENNDCSWYQQCDMKHLDVVGRGYVSEVIRPYTPPGGTGAALLYAMPYEKDGGRGILLVSKVPEEIDLTIFGVVGGVATVIEVAPGDPETALNPPVTRVVGSQGELLLGPYATAVVSELK